MDSSNTTYKESHTPASYRLSNVTDRKLQQGLDEIKKGDEYRDRGDFDKAKAKYEAARKLYPSEAHARLVILPLCKTSMESSDPDRFISVGWRARAHLAKEKVKQAWKHPSPVPSLKQSFFPKPSLFTQSTVASLAISGSQSTFMSVSTCMTTSTSSSRSTMGTPLTSESEIVVSGLGSASDVRFLKAAYKTADDGEREIIERKIYDIIKEFGQHQMTFDIVQELVVLADIQDRAIFLHIVTEILRVLKDKPLLSGIALQGLAVILDSFADDIDLGSAQGAFVEILKLLQECLRGIRIINNDLQLVPLLSALNALLDAMVRRKVVGLDREAVYNDLKTLLTGLTSHPNVMVCFQALYAKQALAIIGNDESLPMSVFRRGKLAFVLAGNVSNMATKLDLASVESAYQNIKEIFDFSIQDRWYQGLIYVDYLVGQRSWWQLENFVLYSKFQSDICFQLGVTLRLEQIAVVHMDVRDGAIKFLTALGKNPISLVAEMVKSTLDRLKSLERSTGGEKKHDVAIPEAYQHHPRPVWDPAWLAAPKGILLKAIQDRDHRDATRDNIPAQLDAIKQAIQSCGSKAAQPSLEDVHSALITYYKRDLVILRVSGDNLDLETCYVNLAIVEAPAQREKDKEDLKEQATVFHRIPSSEAVGQVNMQTTIPLEQLFDKRKLRDGREDIPKTILVQGRAGVGKTTLCKKLVHAHQAGLWRDRFDTVLWLPLRQIKAFKSRTLEGLFREKFFSQGLDQDGFALAHELAVCAQRGRVLFVLDGLDEIAKDTRCEDGLALSEFLRVLFLQQHVVISSRPSGLDRKLLPPSIDLELETIGFSKQNVRDFVSKVLSPKAAATVQDFIQQTPLIQGLVNIPVQLDVICYSWDSLPTEGPIITMTGLYQLMVRKLWHKDALRLGKSAGGETLTYYDISQLEPQDIDELMETEMQHLGYLAFKGLTNDHQIEFDKTSLLCAFRDLKKYSTTGNSGHYPSQRLEMMKQTSFLHTADADIDASTSDSQQTWYFLHLTFQEYFAATWVAQHLQLPTSTGMQGYFASTRSTHDLQQALPGGMMTVEQAKAFVQEHKYNPRYEIMWWMVAGLLEGEALTNFFDLLQGIPRDLIGGRHQQILASCLHEARARLDTTIVTSLDAELMKWLHFETHICHGEDDRSILGSQTSFPENLLVKTLDLRSSAKVMLNTLKNRSTLSEAAIQSLIGALSDKNEHVRSLAASALGNQSTLSEAAIQFLIGTLDHEIADVRYTAVDVLGKQSTLSEAAILSLIGVLHREDADVRFLAASALGSQSTLSEAAIQSLIGALNHENADVRYSAASALGNQSTLSDTAIQSIIGVLNHENADVRSSAALALGNQPTLSEAAIQSLVGALSDEDADVRSSAALVLGNHQSALSEAAIQSLIGALEDKDADVRRRVASALGKQTALSEVAVQSLIGSLSHEIADVRWRAAWAIGNQTTLSEAAIQSLIRVLSDEDAHARSSAASVLGNHKSTLSEAAIQSLTGALEDDNIYVRKRAVWALVKQSTLSEAAIQSIIDALNHENADIRSSAASALGNQSTLSEAATQSCIGALKDENADVRWRAAWALGNQSTLSEAAIQSLIGALKDDDIYVRYSAIDALGKQPTLSKAAILSLIDALKDENADVRSSAASALGNQSTLSESAIQSLIGVLNHENADVRSSAAWPLGIQSTLSEAAIQSLIGVLNYENADVRSSAARPFGNQSTLSEATIQSLIGAFNHKTADGRWKAAWAVGNQPTLSKAAIQSLIGALSDEDADVRSSAASVLGNHQSTLSEAAIQSLIGALKDKDRGVRSSAASALGNQSTLSEAAIQSLIGVLNHENADVRSLAASILGSHQFTLSEVAIQCLISALRLEYADVRSSAASALGNQTTLSEVAIQSLIGALSDEVADVRSSAAAALANQTTLSEVAIQSLIGALSDEDADVRSSAASALGSQYTLSEAANQSPIGALNHENADDRCRAAWAMDQQPSLSEAAIQSLIDALSDEDADVRSSAALVLGNYQSTLSHAAIHSLIGALKDKDRDVRRRAALALGNQSPLSEAAIQSLIGALSDEDADVRSSAALVLGNHQSTLSEAAIQSLIGALKDENADVRRRVASTLGNQTTLSEVAIRSLIGAFNHENADVRCYVAQALGNQTTLPEADIQSLIGALKDKNAEVGSSAASALGNQSTLSEAAIQSLIGALKDGNGDVRRYVEQIFTIHYHSLCMALSGLSVTEIVIAYKNHLFHYSIQHVMSLQVQDNRLCYYTEQGLVRTEPMEALKATSIISAFKAVQREGGIQAGAKLSQCSP